MYLAWLIGKICRLTCAVRKDRKEERGMSLEHIELSGSTLAKSL